MNALARRLERHWFAPAPLTDLAYTRIVLVGAQLLSFMSHGPSGLAVQMQLSRAPEVLFVPIPALKVMMLPFGPWGTRPGAMFLHAVWLGSIAFGLLALVGLYTRLALCLLAAGSTILVAHTYSYGESHHAQALLNIALWVLVFAPSGAALSVDAWRARARAATRFMRFEPAGTEMSEHARWPLRLIQWLLVLSYLSAAMFKLSVAGLHWLNGYTLAYYFVQDAIRGAHVDPGAILGFRVALFLARYPLVCAALAVGALSFELTFGVAVLVPRTAWAYVLAGIMLHGGIYFLQRAPFFQFMALYIAFIGPIRDSLRARRAHRIVDGFAGWPRAVPVTSGTTSAVVAASATGAASATDAGDTRRRWAVVYDGRCPLCIRSVTTLDVIDVSARLVYLDIERDWPEIAARVPSVTPSDVRDAMHVVAPDGTVSRGFFAFRELVRAMPMLWPVALVMYAPLAERVGPRVYARVARGRARVACTAESCGAGHALVAGAK